MSTPVLIVALAAIVCTLFGYIVHRTGSTAGIVDVGRALGALLAELATALIRFP